MVANVGTLVNVQRALQGIAVTRKVVTVTGEVARPSILELPIGTPVLACIDNCGGPTVKDPVYILGGPMMGRIVESTAALETEVITKTNGGIIVLPRGHYLHTANTIPLEVLQKQAAVSCIQCRYCTDQCPRYLLGHGFETHKVMRAFSAGIDSAMEAVQAHMCCECGVCELFSCPMRISPRRINVLLKQRFREQGMRYDGPRVVNPSQTALRPYRKVPVERLVHKINIAGYMGVHPEFSETRPPRPSGHSLAAAHRRAGQRPGQSGRQGQNRRSDRRHCPGDAGRQYSFLYPGRRDRCRSLDNDPRRLNGWPLSKPLG